jgi:hypothetical protein
LTPRRIQRPRPPFEHDLSDAGSTGLAGENPSVSVQKHPRADPSLLDWLRAGSTMREFFG